MTTRVGLRDDEFLDTFSDWFTECDHLRLLRTGPALAPGLGDERLDFRCPCLARLQSPGYAPSDQDMCLQGP